VQQGTFDLSDLSRKIEEEMLLLSIKERNAFIQQMMNSLFLIYFFSHKNR